MDIIQQHLTNIQEALCSYKTVVLPFWKKLSGVSASNLEVVIVEDSHFSWEIGCDEFKAKVGNNTVTMERGFNKMEVLRAINYAYSLLLSTSPTLQPKRDIVRRVVDVGLLVWVNSEDSVVVYEKNVHGCIMENCLINSIYYPLVYVSSSKEAGQTTLFNSRLEELVSFPLDQSILTYYPPDEEAFD